MKFDDIVRHLGDFGPFQKKLYFLLCLPAISVGLQAMLTVFTLGVPTHRCALDNWGNDSYEVQGPYHEKAVENAVPLTNKGVFSPCRLYDVTNSSLNEDAIFMNTTHSCKRWVYDQETYGSTIVTRFNWVCDLTLTKSHLQMMFMLGSLIGCLVLVSPSDFLGRKKMFLAGVILHILSTISIAFAPSFAVLGLLNFLNGMSGIAMWSNGFVVGVELVGPSKRAFTGIVMEYFWTTGTLISVLIAYFVRDWQHLQLIVSAPTVIFLLYYWVMPESPRWLLSKRKYDAADKILQTAARINKTSLPPDIYHRALMGTEEQEPLWKMFTNHKLIVRGLVVFLNWMVCSLGFYGLGLNVGNLGGSVYTNFFISAVSEIIGFSSCLLLLNRIGRKSFHCATMILGGLCCTATIIPILYGEESLNWLIVVLALTGRGFVSASFATIWLYSSELFPTVIRNSALAVANVCARVGATVSPYIANISLLIPGDWGRAVPLIIFGASLISAGLLALLLPETLNQDLPESIKDAKEMKKINRSSKVPKVDFIRSQNDEAVELKFSGSQAV